MKRREEKREEEFVNCYGAKSEGNISERRSQIEIRDSRSDPRLDRSTDSKKVDQELNFLGQNVTLRCK